jgi:hypothetical protein
MDMEIEISEMDRKLRILESYKLLLAYESRIKKKILKYKEQLKFIEYERERIFEKLKSMNNI